MSVGYGSPEVAAIMHDLGRRDDTDAVLLEPDEADRPPLDANPDWAFNLQRISADGIPSQTLSWTRHFQAAARKEIQRIKPDILIIFGGSVFGTLALLDPLPPTIIYHAYEQIADLHAETLQAHKLFLEDVDLVMTPSLSRLAYDCQILGTWPKTVHGLRNVADVAYPVETPRVSASDKLKHFIWCGNLSRKRTFADFFLGKPAEDFPLQMYGRVSNEEGDDLNECVSAAPHLTHYGIVAAGELSAAVARAAFSLVWWNPQNSVGHYHLASNRFYTALQLGTPSICGPHPQCIEINKRYDCAIIMENWTPEAYITASRRATDMLGTSAYDNLLQNCADARHDGVNWPSQSTGIISAILRTADSKQSLPCG